ncbi:hypothetical protein J5690_05785 [bacterium]|nr:hypothetical protein [bacterium]
MQKLFVVADVSGSMCCGGKLFVAKSVLQTLDALKRTAENPEEIAVEKINWDGTESGFEELMPKLSGKCSMILTDGYSILDNCGKSRIAKKFFEENKNSLFVILCGGDAVDISKFKDFSMVRTVKADNVLFAVETLLGAGKHQEKEKSAGETGSVWE